MVNDIACKKNMVSINVSMSSDNKKILKKMALEHDMTVSGLISSWINEKVELDKQIVSCADGVTPL